MDNLIDKINEIDARLKRVEDLIGISNKKSSKDVRMKPKNETPPIKEEIINGFTKSQLRVMFTWANNTKIQQLSKNDFEELKRWGMLWEFYPDAPEKYEDIIL